ncbi:MAG: FMN-binding glutamate synthase family protein [Myxococcota bacterium]|nr:FMN-binding glutamate synthase family protein [Deltaproteobacteria bacterium]MDQ3334395.1 FMN-binding glutamate synthase family protein [Myxococcota bacterium]
MSTWAWVGLGVLTVLVIVAIHDLTQKKKAILRNFPIVGHFRYLLETIGPELRQYIVTSNDEERPFSRDQRRWVYASAKKENNYFSFGTDNDIERPGYILVRHSAFPIHTPHAGEPGYDPTYPLPCVRVLGGVRGRKHAFRPTSIVNTSAMSYGSLSPNAVEAINRGAALAGAMQNTGEGGISDYHRKGGDVIWQIGTGYFGARDDHGRFSMERMLESVASARVRAIEIKLSQGAKPGLGGVLPAAKITPEIARIRGIPMGRDCISPANHTAFTDVSSMLDFIERVADATGLPVGIKSAVGDLQFWRDLAAQIGKTKRAPDFITIDGGEGGTGAAPLTFTDHVAMPFKLGFTQVYREFAEAGVNHHVVFIGSGKLGFPEHGLLALALGCDMIAVAREAMLAIGCIQAQRCHTGHCPTGVATQNRWLMRGLDPTLKSARLANYLATLRKDLTHLAHAIGYAHPSLVPLDAIDLVDSNTHTRSARAAYGYEAGWGLPREADVADMRADASAAA